MTTQEGPKPLSAPAAGMSGALRTIVGLIYITAFVAFVGWSLYMAFVERLPWTEPQVFLPLLGAVWFAVRTVMLFRQPR
jgi:hypothetical protein